MVLRDFVTGVLIMAVVGGGLTLAAVPLLPPLEIAADPRLWLAFLPLALLGVLVQTGAEELVFRGYVQSHLAARFGAPLVYMTVPSLLFGLAHYNPGELGANLWIVETGLAAGDKVTVDGIARLFAPGSPIVIGPPGPAAPPGAHCRRAG